MNVYVTTTPTKQIATTSLAAIFDHLTPAEVELSLSRLYHLKVWPYRSAGCTIVKLPLYRKKQK